MQIVLWIAIGAFAGSMAKLVMPGPRAGGVRIGLVLGVAGALAGGVLGAVLAGEITNAIDVRSVLMAISGTLWALLCYRAVAMRLHETPAN